MELARRDQRTAWLRPRLGCALRRPASTARGFLIARLRGSHEGRPILRRARPAYALKRGLGAEADDADRPSTSALARHAVLRALRAPRIHPLSRVRRENCQRVLP